MGRMIKFRIFLIVMATFIGWGSIDRAEAVPVDLEMEDMDLRIMQV